MSKKFRLKFNDQTMAFNESAENKSQESAMKYTKNMIKQI